MHKTRFQRPFFTNRTGFQSFNPRQTQFHLLIKILLLLIQEIDFHIKNQEQIIIKRIIIMLKHQYQK